MTRTIFLDAAGTLIEPAEPVAAVYARHFAAVGRRLSEAALETAFREVFSNLPPPDYQNHPDGDAAEHVWWRAVVAGAARRCEVHLAEEAFESLFQDLFSHYGSGSAWAVFPEVRSVLETLSAAGYQLAVVSNFDLRLHRILADLGLDHWFAAVVTSADARARKPDPAIFLHTMARVGAEAATTVHIGDHPVADGAGARAIGIRSFVLDRPRITLSDALVWIESGK